MKTFAAQRTGLLTILEPLPIESWNLTVTVIDMVGKRLVRNVWFYAEKLARHERTHIKQVERIAKEMKILQGSPAGNTDRQE